MMIMSKICTRCPGSKTLDLFYKRKKSKDGHASQCKKCQDLRTELYRQKYPDKRRISNKKWRIANAEYAKSLIAQWRDDNRQKFYGQIRKWKESNLLKIRSYGTKRRCAKLLRLPIWADLKSIEEFYLNRPPGYHVDHIIPLQGKNVSGLHVLANLQYLSAKQNLQKGNKF